MMSKANIPNNWNTTYIEKNTAKLSIGDVFNDRTGAYLNELTLFLARFNVIPNFIQGVDIDCYKANKWFVEKHHAEIKDTHYNKGFSRENTVPQFDDIFYFLYDDLLVYFDTNMSKVKLLFCKTEMSQVELLLTGIKKFIKKNEKQKAAISLLIESGNGIGLRSFKIAKPKLNMKDNYNDDFNAIHQTVLKRLTTNNDKGLILLHGKPGTGKTSYIRYLITLINKDVIFLPPNMAAAIANPDLIKVLIENPNSILVVEDAENIIVDREKNGRSPVTTLLNLTDGLLADCLNIQVICTFNTDISKVDNALIRKGRLIAKYEFKELDTDRAQKLSNKLCFNTKINKPMTLTEIYNQNDISFEQQQQKNAIGFMANNN